MSGINPETRTIVDRVESVRPFAGSFVHVFLEMEDRLIVTLGMSNTTKGPRQPKEGEVIRITGRETMSQSASGRVMFVTNGNWESIDELRDKFVEFTKTEDFLPHVADRDELADQVERYVDEAQHQDGVEYWGNFDGIDAIVEDFTLYFGFA